MNDIDRTALIERANAYVIENDVNMRIQIMSLTTAQEKKMAQAMADFAAAEIKAERERMHSELIAIGKTEYGSCYADYSQANHKEREHKISLPMMDFAFDAGWNAAIEHAAGQWVAVETGLPEIHKTVIWSLNSSLLVIGFLSDDRRLIYPAQGEGYVHFEDALAWQELPKPYTSEGTK